MGKEYGMTEDGMVEPEDITITVKCTVRKRWAAQLIGMFNTMQHLGSIGASRNITFYADGDGDFRPKFDLPSDIPSAEGMSCKTMTKIVENPEYTEDFFYDAG